MPDYPRKGGIGQVLKAFVSKTDVPQRVAQMQDLQNSLASVLKESINPIVKGMGKSILSNVMTGVDQNPEEEIQEEPAMQGGDNNLENALKQAMSGMQPQMAGGLVDEQYVPFSLQMRKMKKPKETWEDFMKGRPKLDISHFD